MRSYELYLDESGTFIDEEQNKSPSLIGGILVKKGDLTDETASKIMLEALSTVPGDYVHINDIAKIDKKLAGKVAISIMEKIKNIPAYVVIFQNNELLDFKDDKLLYLNIMSEGITNLLEKLSLEKSDAVELNVIAAVRRDLEAYDESAIIEIEEYSKRIKERIYMKISENNLFLSKNCTLNFELSSARKNKKLKISDVVCNSKLTKDSGKFDDEQKAFLEEIFKSSKYVFNVFRANIQKKLSEYLLQNNVADAIFLLNAVDDEQTKKELIRLVIGNINTMPISNLRIQLDLLSLKIKSMIDVQRNLLLCEKFLLNLQQNIIDKIKIKDVIINKLKLDISLYLLTIYTHNGDCINSKKQIEISRQELNNLSGSWNFLEYYYILKTREAIYYNTCFENKKTIEVLTEAISKFEKILNTMNEDQGFGSIKSDMLAKLYGTRLQSYIALITPSLPEETRAEYYGKALQDSDYAISQFVSEADKRRQYQYRCALENSMDKFDEAVKYLMKIAGQNKKDFAKFLEYVENINDFSKNFIICNYLEIMQNAVNKGNAIGIEMYNAYRSNVSIYSEYSLEDEDEVSLYKNNKKSVYMHPFEMIFWRLAQTLKKSDKNLANIYYDKAIEICQNINEVTINVVELAIEADKLTISKDINKDKTVLIAKYKSIVENERFSDIHNFLFNLKDEFEMIELFDDVSDIKNACEKIATEIKI